MSDEEQEQDTCLPDLDSLSESQKDLLIVAMHGALHDYYDQLIAMQAEFYKHGDALNILGGATITRGHWRWTTERSDVLIRGLEEIIDSLFMLSGETGERMNDADMMRREFANIINQEFNTDGGS